MNNNITEKYKQNKYFSYFFYTILVAFLSTYIFRTIWFNVDKKPNIVMGLSNSDFKNTENTDYNNNDFIVYNNQTYILSLTEKAIRLNSDKIEKLNDDETLFINSTLIKFIKNDLCYFCAKKAINNEKTTYLDIDNQITMKCDSPNHGTFNELYGYTDVGNFYGNKGLDLWQDGARFISDKYKIYDHGDIIDLIDNVKVYIYKDKSFKEIKDTITANRLHYNKNTNTIDLYENVKIVNTSMTIDGQYSKLFLSDIEGKTELDYAIIKDKVKYTNNSDTNIFGDEMRYYKNEGIVDIEGNVLMKNDTAISKAPYFAYDINSDIGKFITEHEYTVLKKQYPYFMIDIVKHIIYTNDLNIDNKAIKTFDKNIVKDNVKNKNKSKIIIKNT